MTLLCGVVTLVNPFLAGVRREEIHRVRLAIALASFGHNLAASWKW